MKRLLVAIILTVLLIIVIFPLLPRPDLGQYEQLKTPRIVSLPDQKMVVVEAKGDPNAAARSAFSTLFNAYYRIPGVPKGSRPPAPRARWPRGLETPKNEWTGLYALPVPETATAVPHGTPARLETWQYGTVAEILHVGPYTDEAPTVEQLLSFIAAQGYAVAGDHEEEYLRGPGIFFKGNPKNYFTIIRYRITKK